MTEVHQTRFHEQLPDKKLHYTLCPHDCRIPDNGRDACPDCGTAIDVLGMSEV